MDGKRQEAPDELELIREFVNTREITAGWEELASAAALGRWLSARGLSAAGVRVSRADLSCAIELREALRSILFAHGDGSRPPEGAWEVLDRVARQSRLRPRFSSAGTATVEPEADGADGALGRLVAIVHEAIGRGTWPRLKACREPSCQYAFFDHTRNRSGSWCTMEVCGNRAKARAYRSRHRHT